MYSKPETDNLLDMASFVDLQFRGTYIAADCLEFIKTRAVAEIQALMEVQAAMVSEPHTSTEARAAATAEVAVDREAKKVKQSLGSFFKKPSLQSGKAALAGREATEVELKSYLQTLEVDGETDPLAVPT